MQEAQLVHNKKRYIQWFLRTFPLKEPGMFRVLDLLLHRDRLLSRTRFVEDVRELPNALIISATDSVTVSYLCRLYGFYYENMDDIIACLEYNPPEELFIWLSFDREFLCSICSSVLEQKPELGQMPFGYGMIMELEKQLNDLIRDKERQKTQLQEEIDEALVLKDREKFQYLSSLYRKLLE